MSENIGRHCNVKHLTVEACHGIVVDDFVNPRAFIITGVLDGKYLINLRTIGSFIQFSVDPKCITDMY